MPEIDFDREGFPHKKGSAKTPSMSPEETLSRLKLLPLLGELSSEQRHAFDAQIIRSYAPDIEEPSRGAAQETIRRLPLDELEEVICALEFLVRAESQST